MGSRYSNGCVEHASVRVRPIAAMFADATCSSFVHPPAPVAPAGGHGDDAHLILVGMLLLVVVALAYLGRMMYLRWMATKRAVFQGLVDDGSTLMPQAAL